MTSMAKKNASEMQAWARLGVEARLAEIESERARILQAFPGLRTSAGSRGAAARAADNSAAAGTGRQPRKMSAAARKRISDAQKKRWAAQKAAKR